MRKKNLNLKKLLSDWSASQKWIDFYAVMTRRGKLTFKLKVSLEENLFKFYFIFDIGLRNDENILVILYKVKT